MPMHSTRHSRSDATVPHPTERKSAFEKSHRPSELNPWHTSQGWDRFLQVWSGPSQPMSSSSPSMQHGDCHDKSCGAYESSDVGNLRLIQRQDMASSDSSCLSACITELARNHMELPHTHSGFTLASCPVSKPTERPRSFAGSVTGLHTQGEFEQARAKRQRVLLDSTEFQLDRNSNPFLAGLSPPPQRSPSPPERQKLEEPLEDSTTRGFNLTRFPPLDIEEPLEVPQTFAPNATRHSRPLKRQLSEESLDVGPGFPAVFRLARSQEFK